MSGIVDIVNIALSHLGDEAEVISISPPDATIQATQAGRFFPIARDRLLEAHPWTFAIARQALALVVAPAPSEWLYAYALPNQCLKPRAVYNATALDDSASDDFIVESDADGNLVLYTNTVNAVLRYTRVVEDTTKFTPGATAALSRLLAHYLAGPIIKGATGEQIATAQLKLYAIELADAKTLDSNTDKRSNYRTRQPDAVLARGAYGGAYRWFP